MCAKGSVVYVVDIAVCLSSSALALVDLAVPPFFTPLLSSVEMCAQGSVVDVVAIAVVGVALALVLFAVPTFFTPVFSTFFTIIFTTTGYSERTY